MTADPLAATLAYAAAKNRRDVEATVAAFAPDGVYQTAGSPEVRGHDKLRAFFTALFAALPDYAGTFAPPAVTGRTVAAWGEFGGTTSGQWYGESVPAGRRVAVPVTFICTFDEAGRLLSDVGYFDPAVLRRQLGLPQALSPVAADFLKRFRAFWDRPSGARVPELIAPDATIHFSGQAPVTGAQYCALMDSALAATLGIRVAVQDVAERGDLLFIFWRASAQVHGRPVAWQGVDRFRLRDGMAVEEHVIFDPSVFAPPAAAAA